MSAGSSNSNLGYADISPYNTSSVVNGTSSNYSGNFSSNVIPGLPGLSGAKSNIDAASSKVPGICMKGGAKYIKKKIKNITKQYKRMRKGSRKSKHLKTKLRKSRKIARYIAGGYRKRKHATRRRFRKQRGGYAQYSNNMPNTPTYQVAGIHLSPNNLAEANPPPYVKLDNCVNCVDNYNHYTNMGVPSKGH